MLFCNILAQVNQYIGVLFAQVISVFFTGDRSRIAPEMGANPSRGTTILLCKNSKKLHEIETLLGNGGCVLWGCTLDP